MARRRGLIRWRQPWGIGILCIVIVLLYDSGMLQPVLDRTIPIIQIPQQWLYSATQSWRAPKGISTDELEKKNKALEQRVEELAGENTQLKAVIEQSTLLEEQISFLQEKKYTAVPALVTTATADGLTQQYILNRGSSHGVTTGQVVIVDNGIVVGVITETTTTFSRMIAVTSTQIRVGAHVQNQQASPGIISGEHELSLRMNYIPQFDTITPRSIVTTSGIDPHIPEGLVIGEVAEVLKEPGALFQQAVVTPYLHSDQLSVVSIIIQ